MAYVLPQVKVFQQFRQISQDVVGNLNACIIGPHYQLARYDESSEKELTKLGVLYSGDLLDSEYPLKVRNVDTNYVKVFFEKVSAKYAELENAHFDSDGGYVTNYTIKPVRVTGSSPDVEFAVNYLAVQCMDERSDAPGVYPIGPGDRVLTGLVLNKNNNSGDYYFRSYYEYFSQFDLGSPVGDPTCNENLLINSDVDHHEICFHDVPPGSGYFSKIYLAATDDRVFSISLSWSVINKAHNCLRAGKPFEISARVEPGTKGYVELTDSKFTVVFPAKRTSLVNKTTVSGTARYSGFFTDNRAYFADAASTAFLESLLTLEDGKYDVVPTPCPYAQYGDGRADSDDEDDVGTTVFYMVHDDSLYALIFAGDLVYSPHEGEGGNYFGLFRRSLSDESSEWVKILDSATEDDGLEDVKISSNGRWIVFFDRNDGAYIIIDLESKSVNREFLDDKIDYFGISGFTDTENHSMWICGDHIYQLCLANTSKYIGIADLTDLTKHRNAYIGTTSVTNCKRGICTDDGLFIDTGAGFQNFRLVAPDADADLSLPFNAKAVEFTDKFLVALYNGSVYVRPLLENTQPRLVPSTVDIADAYRLAASTFKLLHRNVERTRIYLAVETDGYALVEIYFDGNDVETAKSRILLYEGQDPSDVYLFAFKNALFARYGAEGRYLASCIVDDNETALLSSEIKFDGHAIRGDYGEANHFFELGESNTTYANGVVRNDAVGQMNNAFLCRAFSLYGLNKACTDFVSLPNPNSAGRFTGLYEVVPGNLPDIAVGDSFEHTHNNKDYSNVVKSIKYFDDVSYIGRIDDSGTYGGYAVVFGSKYTGPKNTVYTVEVLSKSQDSSMVEISVSDSENVEPTRIVNTLATNIQVSTKYNVALKPDNSVTVGDVIRIPVFAALRSKPVGFIPLHTFPGEFDGGYFECSLSKRFDPVQVDEFTDDGLRNWAATPEGIIFYPGIRVKDKDGNEIEVSSAQPYVEYRALQTKYADTIHEVASTNDVQTMLGSINMDNPLAQGCYHAILNSGQQPVFFIAIKSDDQQGYDAALERLEVINNIYSLVPMTTDDAVLRDLQAHVKKMSGEETKLWRIAVVGLQTDKTIAIYNNAHHKLDGEYDATVEDTLVTFEDKDETVATDEVWPGDEFRYYYDDEGNYETRIIERVIDNTHVVLTEPFEQDSTVMRKCEVWRELTSAQWIDYVAEKISAFRDRRMYAIFPEVLWSDGNKYPGYIGAAAIAGLISSVPPQQGLTNITLNGFDDIPMVYSSYTRTQLNHIADYGGLIIMQDVPGGQVYVRHQVSTAARDGNLLTTELSVTKDVDAISYYMSDILDPYIGKYNITPVLLDQIKTTVQGALNYLCSYNTGSGLLGPMLLATEDTKIVGIRQHETLKDHVIVSVTLDIPLPCNVIELYLSV